MCSTCGCSDHNHTHEDENGGVVQRIERDILGENNRLAMFNRGWLTAKNIFAINLVSSPGSGKTSLLEATIKILKDEIKISVIEGDQHTSNDADRIMAQGVKATQINTQSGCHLDAHMIQHALESLNPDNDSLLFIENVGNLVCPAMFDLGESLRVVVISVTEGDDKPLKYPYMFAESNICIINKIDLLPYLTSDINILKENCLKVNPNLHFFEISATTNTGVNEWCDFLRSHLGKQNCTCHHKHHHHGSDFFDSVASKWDEITHHDISKIERILSKTKLKKGDLVLDVGTGTGVLIPFIASIIGAKGTITAVDASPKMIEIALNKYSYLPNVTFEIANIEKSMQKTKYNHIILFSIYPHLDNPIDTITSLVNNNLAPKGNLIIAHSQSKEEINGRHRTIEDEINSLSLPAVETLIMEFEKREIKVIEYADNSEYYFLLLAKG